MSAHVDISPAQGCLHHCLPELSLIEHATSIWWKTTHHQQVSWMVGQMILEKRLQIWIHSIFCLYLTWTECAGKPLALLVWRLPIQPHWVAVKPSSWEPMALAWLMTSHAPSQSTESICQLLLMNFQLRSAQCFQSRSDWWVYLPVHLLT